MMRPMVLEFPDDPVCQALDRQYMMGSSILAAPIFNPDGEAVTYLPEGVWTHLFTGERKQGGRFIKEQYDYFGLPVYVRPNSIIVTGREDGAVYDYHENAVVHAYEVAGSGGNAAKTDAAESDARVVTGGGSGTDVGVGAGVCAAKAGAGTAKAVVVDAKGHERFVVTIGGLEGAKSKGLMGISVRGTHNGFTVVIHGANERVVKIPAGCEKACV